MTARFDTLNTLNTINIYGDLFLTNAGQTIAAVIAPASGVGSEPKATTA